MSAGSLKDLVRTLHGALSAPSPLYPLPEDVLSVINSYIDKHDGTDDHESQRLHEELLVLHALKVQNNPEKHAFFLACFRNLRPAIIGVERLLKWWEVLVKPTLDSMGQAKAVISDARAIVLSVLAYDDDDDPTGEKAEASSVFTDKLFEVFLEKTKLLSSDRGAGFREEQSQRFICGNVEAVLLAYGKRRPLSFLQKIDCFVVQKEYRLQILGLLCSFVRLQGPHLYQILQTPLLDHLLQCLENDTSTTVISLALTVLIMFMPHLCNSLGEYLPRLFVVYTRVICWDRFGIVRAEETKFAGTKDEYSRTHTPQPTDRAESDSVEGWQKLDSSFETATSTSPDVSDYFTFLYGLYPINFISFIREPYKFLERVGFKGVDMLEIEEETVRQRSDHYRQQHTLHPNFLTFTAETELSDQSRWMKVEPADVTAQCIGLVNNNIPMRINRGRKKSRRYSKPAIPEALVPTEEIHLESLLGNVGEDMYSADSDTSWRESEGTIVHSPTQEPFKRVDAPSAAPPRDRKAPDSPTLPATISPSDQEEQLQDMLDLQEQLRASLHHDVDSPIGPEPTAPLPASPPEYSTGATASPRLGAYMHHLHQTTVPRSPALRPATSDTQGTIAYLQREVMLLKNDLNFERYLKQQHLSHIGHLQRKHIKESTAEADTQNLINTNKSLKAKLEDAKKAYAASRQETLKSKNQAKKWEAELSAKIRTLREEQKAWRQDEEATKKALQVAREEADHLRKLLSESEAEGLRCRQKLQSLSSEMEEVDKLRSFVDHLSNKLAEYENRSDDFELQRHNEESAMAQVERMKLRLTSREQDMQKMKRNYDTKIHELESRLDSSSNPMPPCPGPEVQDMIDSALQSANKRLATMKKAHANLLTRYTELEIKYIELQAQEEVDSLPMRHNTLSRSGTSHGYDVHSPHGTSDTDSLHHNGRHTPRGGPLYQLSEEGLSPQSSYTDSSSNDAYPGGNAYLNSHAHRSAPASSATPRAVSPGLTSPPKYPGSAYGHPDSISFDHPPPLQRKLSAPDSMAIETIESPSRGSDDVGSLKTVHSSTSSERRDKIKPQSEMRIRGRGGVQNIGKKDPGEKEERRRKKDEEKKHKKSKFTTGSGLAGIRGFV